MLEFTVFILQKSVTWHCDMCPDGRGAGNSSRERHRAVCPNMDVSRSLYVPQQREIKKEKQ